MGKLRLSSFRKENWFSDSPVQVCDEKTGTISNF